MRILFAVLRARLYAQRRVVFYSCAAAFVAGLAQPAGFAAPLFLCSLLGIAMALMQSPGLHSYLDRCEQNAPLFGRQLARARALVPCVAATLAALGYAAGLLLRGAEGVPLTLLVTVAAAIAAIMDHSEAMARARTAATQAMAKWSAMKAAGAEKR